MIRARFDEGVAQRGVRSVAPAAIAVLLGAGALWAHAVVVPATSTTRAFETYTLRVPNEKDVPTVRVEIEFPPDVFVVSFAEVPGWELVVERDDMGRAVGAAWAGELAPHRFVELSFVGVNPAEPTTLVWAVDQIYRGPEGEEVVAWSGPADSEFPASRTEVQAPGSDQDGAEAAGRARGGTLPTIALLVALTALVVAVRARRAA